MRKKFLITTVIIALAFFAKFSVVLGSDDSSVCLDCHEDMAASLAGTPHDLAATSHLSSPIKTTCGSCHSGWEAHIEDPTPDNIDSPNDLISSRQAEICGSCHLTPHQAAMVSTDPHARADLSCTSCHMVHGNQNNFLAKDDQENYCLACHSSVGFEFQRRSAHPLESGNIRCVDCHNLAAIEDPQLAVGFDWTCQKCHAEKAGPFLYEHPVTYNHLAEGGGCVECHEPHGSSVDRLLKQTGNGTCLQCHGTPPGHFTQHSGLGSKLECVQCHSDIHGSFDNRLLLDPDLGTKFFPDCYQSGCHARAN